jgi:phenylalanyl-tRNA synthetase beta chain
LHATLCRHRKFVAIGTHDLDTIKGPFLYRALPPKEICFKALNQAKEMTAEELMVLYEEDLKLKAYLGIIRSSPVYPVIFDANGVVLSMPPIINGEHSKISLKTKNVFIECTALDLTKAILTLNEVICSFSQYSNPAFTIEGVEVINEGKSEVYPKIETRDVLVDVEYVRNITGSPELTSAQCVQLLKKMDVRGEVISDLVFKAIVPPTRGDILHKCDIAEDVAVAIGFNNLKPELPNVAGTIGKQLPINKLTNELRKVCTCAKYNECLTLCLVSKVEQFTKMRKKGPSKDNKICVLLSNPISSECDSARVSLLPGLLKCLRSNIDVKLPIRFFEIGDIVLLDPSTETGARNARRLAALYSDLSAGFEYIHGLLDYIMVKLGIPCDKEVGYQLRTGKGILP